MVFRVDFMNQSESIDAEEAQKNWTNYLDKSLRQPVAVKRRDEKFLTISLEQLKNGVPFTLRLNEEDSGSSHLYFAEIPQVIGYGEDIEEAKVDFSYGLMEYAALYMDDFEKHFEAPNLQQQFLQITTLHHMTREEITQFIEDKLEILM